MGTHAEQPPDRPPRRSGPQAASRAAVPAARYRQELWICYTGTTKSGSKTFRRSNDSKVAQPRSGLPPVARRSRPYRARTPPGARLFRPSTRVRHHPRPLRLGDGLLPAVLHPDVSRTHGALAGREPRPEGAVRFFAALLAELARAHMALCRPCLRFGSGRGPRAVRMGRT